MDDVVVVGGGAVGLCIAYGLLEHGAAVTILEEGRIGSGASGGNIGWITPTLATPVVPPSIGAALRMTMTRNGPLILGPALTPSLVRWLFEFRRSATPERYRRSVASLLALAELSLDVLDTYRRNGVGFEMRTTGLLAVAASPAGVDWLLDAFDLLQGLGFSGRLERLSGDSARDLEPALSSAIACAARTSVERVVRPESLCAGLSRYLHERGVAIRTSVRVRRLRVVRGGLRVDTETDTLDARSVVVATGVDANSLLKPLGCELPIVGAKGYSITVRPFHGAPRHPLYLSDSKVGVSPFREGVRLGGFFELGAASRSVRRRRLVQIIGSAREYLREPLTDALDPRVEPWAGFRPTTSDSLPYIGEVPGASNVYVAVGHGMLGMTLAPATGTLLARLVSGYGTPAELRPFAIPRRI